MKKKNKKGFTLVEIIVVLVILAILAAIAVPAVLGYVDDAKEARQLSKLRESLIAAQVTFTKSAALGERSNDHYNGDYYLTENQSKDFLKYLEEKPYILLFGAGNMDAYGENSKEASHIYCIVYQKTEESKPWFFDGKKWSHRYLWNNERKTNQVDNNNRAMDKISGNGYGVDYNVNVMNNIKDKNGNKTAVTIYYTYLNGQVGSNLKNSTGTINNMWNTLKDNEPKYNK